MFKNLLFKDLIKKEKVFDTIIHFPNYSMFFVLFREIYFRGDYQISLSNKPSIFDYGANIGMASLYFKHQYPDALIECYEPDDNNYYFLKKNTSKFVDIKCHKLAVSDSNKSLPFCESSSGSLVSKVDSHGTKKVKAKLITEIIKYKSDLVKMDIEGSENQVVAKLVRSKRLDLVDNYIIEYHHSGDKSKLGNFVSYFENKGYGLQLRATNLRLAEKHKNQNILLRIYRKKK